jgi:hypothetical protein
VCDSGVPCAKVYTKNPAPLPICIHQAERTMHLKARARCPVPRTVSRNATACWPRQSTALPMGPQVFACYIKHAPIPCLASARTATFPADIIFSVCSQGPIRRRTSRHAPASCTRFLSILLCVCLCLSAGRWSVTRAGNGTGLVLLLRCLQAAARGRAPGNGDALLFLPPRRRPGR